MRRLVQSIGILIVIALVPSIVSAQDKYFDSNGVRIRYVEQGSGEPIVLIHGLASSIERGWVETGVLANLAHDYRVIALDTRGHGKSGKPRGPSAYGEEMARDVVRLLDYLKIPRAHIVGYSFGGRITAKLLMMSPERFLTATLGGSSGDRNWTDASKKASEEAAVELERDGSFRTLVLGVAPTDEPKPTAEAIRQRSAELLQVNDRNGLAALYRGRQGLAVSNAQMTAVRVPTLAIVGSADGALTGVRELQGVMPSLMVVVIDGAVHSAANSRGAQRRPEFVGAIREFIAAYHHVTSK